MASRSQSLGAVHAQLRRAALSLPEAYEDSPWGEPVFKVRGKIFLFLSGTRGELSVTAKLPQTGAVALMLPNVGPTGYNLGRSGWVSATFGPATAPSLKMLRAWIDESYRAVAPRRLVAGLESAGDGDQRAVRSHRRAPARRRGEPERSRGLHAQGGPPVVVAERQWPAGERIRHRRRGPRRDC